MIRRAARGSIPAITMIVSALLGSALAQEPDEDAASCTEDAMLVFDASGSMVQKDRHGETLLEGARDAAKIVLPQAARTRNMGLVTLGPGKGDQCSNVELKVPVQPQAATPIISEIDSLPADGGTPLAKAVEAAADALDYRNRPGVMVVVSDGDETCGRDPCAAAAALKAQARGLTIHVISLRGPSGSPRNIACLADETHGKTVKAEDAEQLTTALRQTLVCPQVSGVKGNTDKSRFR